MTQDEIRQVCKELIGYSRHVVLSNKKQADSVLYHCMLGYEAALNRTTPLEEGKPSEKPDFEKRKEIWDKALTDAIVINDGTIKPYDGIKNLLATHFELKEISIPLLPDEPTDEEAQEMVNKVKAISNIKAYHEIIEQKDQTITSLQSEVSKAKWLINEYQSEVDRLTNKA